ncbi:hypothetical protein FRB90_000380 [Tulasnella sp. 427]|nr:hypothetical protein FRB90_000380 [Tulasnella sp. 427]
MPIDYAEYDRWNIQHDALRQAVGLCYDSFIGKTLVNKLSVDGPKGRAPHVLDIGTGSGKWAMEIAWEYPLTEVVAIDYRRPPTPRDFPVNCKFEQDDVNLGLSHYQYTFDVVHMRTVDLGIDDYPHFMYEVARILRDGGLLLLFKPAMCLFHHYGKDEYGDDIYLPLQDYGPNDEPPPGYHLQKVMCLVDETIKKRGGSEDAWAFYREILESNPNYDPDSITIRWLNVPVCPFPARTCSCPACENHAPLFERSVH